MLAEHVFFLQFVTKNGEVQLKNSQDIGAKESLFTSHFITSHEMKRQWCFDIQPWVDICPPLPVPSKVHLGCTCLHIHSIDHLTIPVFWLVEGPAALASHWSRYALCWSPFLDEKRVDKREGSAVHSTLQEGRFRQLVRILGPVLQDKALSLDHMLLNRGEHL